MPGVPTEYYYPLFASFMLILTIVYVPKEEFGRLFWTSLLWGYFMSALYIPTFSGLFHLFHYVRVKPFVFLGAPVWLNVAWLSALMFYLRFLPTRKVWYVFPLYVFIFAWASATLDRVFNEAGLLIYTGWNPFYQFILAYAWFYGAARYQWALDKAQLMENAKEAR